MRQAKTNMATLAMHLDNAREAIIAVLDPDQAETRNANFGVAQASLLSAAQEIQSDLQSNKELTDNIAKALHAMEEAATCKTICDGEDTELQTDAFDKFEKALNSVEKHLDKAKIALEPVTA